MSKKMSARERRLQKLLIPLNIFVCIISLAAAISLFFMPILDINLGKIIKHEDTKALIEEKIDEQVKGGIEGTEQEGIDFKPVVASIVTNVFDSVEGELKISAYGASKVAFAKGGDKTSAVLDELLFGEKAFATQLIDSVVDGVAGIFKKPEGKVILEEVIVSAIATSLIENLDTDNFTKDKITEVTNVFRDELSKVENNDVTPLVNKMVDKVAEVVGADVTVSDEERESIRKEVQQIYDDTVAELDAGEKVTMESIICVAVSKNVDLAGFDITKIFDQIMNGEENNGENGEKDNGNGENVTPTGYALSEGEADAEPPAEKEVVTTYEELLDQMNFDEDTIKTTLRTNLETLLNDEIDKSDVGKYMQYYGYLFYGWLIFIVPWVILFLFSFFHMLAKNKRFTMWYVKLYSFLPCLVFFVAPMVAPALLKRFAPSMLEGDAGRLIPAALSGVSSFTWISGACYVLLWLVSIFWAFPIKHKIRKERKACKLARRNGDYSYDDMPADGGRRRAPKRRRSDAYDTDYGYGSHGDSYGGDDYGSYDSDYDTYDGDYDSYDSDYDTYDGDYDSYDSDFDDDDLGF